MRLYAHTAVYVLGVVSMGVLLLLPPARFLTVLFVQGKELSFNNIADADTAIECVRQFSEAACVIVKHANPCGVECRREHSRSV